MDTTFGGAEIAWEDYTQYDSARIWGIDRWKALGRVNIKPDDAVSITDLEYEDYYSSTDGYMGYWQQWYVGADLIAFNRYNMDQQSNCQRWTGVHELGHALGLGHSYRGQVMNSYCEPTIQSPQSHDRSDYYALWG